MGKQVLLTATELAQKVKTVGRYSVGGVQGGGLSVRVIRGAKGVALRYWDVKTRRGGRCKEWTIGTYSGRVGEVGLMLKDARVKAQAILTAWNDEGRDIVQEGKDAQTAEREKAEEVPETMTAVFPQWIAFRKGQGARKYVRDFDAMQARFDEYVKPLIGEKKPREVTAADVAAILAPLTASAPSVLEKVQGFLRQFFRWCMMEENGYRGMLQGNPATSENLKDRLPPRSTWAKKGHYAMCPLKDLPRFVKYLTEGGRLDTVGAMACLFTILTASRLSNIGQSAAERNQNYAVWEDIDLTGKVWQIPAEKMKVPDNGAHVVPLSTQAVAILERVQKLGLTGDKAVFLNSRGSVVSDGAFAALIRKVSALDIAAGGTGFLDPENGNKVMTMHGTARAGFRTWGSDELKNSELKETALHHKREELGRSYLRSDMFKARAQIMQEWGDFLFSKCAPDWAAVKP